MDASNLDCTPSQRVCQTASKELFPKEQMVTKYVKTYDLFLRPKAMKHSPKLEAYSGFSLADLPENCLANIIAHSNPHSACLLASVCSDFAAAESSDAAWEGILPADHDTLCQSARPSVLTYKRKKDCFLAMSKGFRLGNGFEKYALLQESGGVCRSLSVQNMSVAWGNDERFWKIEFSQSSAFGRVAHLLAVCWLEVKGKWSCSLPPGTYSVFWRIKVNNPQGGRRFFLEWREPVHFEVSTDDGQKIQRMLDAATAPFMGYERWAEFEVGQIRVGGRSKQVKEVNLEFSLKELDCSYWKGGLFVDCLTLRALV
eukprot:jgi/Mesen1/3872/ME000207S02879